MTNLSAVIILNRGSGSTDNDGIVSELGALAATYGVTCDIVIARSGNEMLAAARQAAESTHEVVIAGGGDGTINAVANALVGSKKRLGILPLGTFNYFARQLEIPADLEAAFRGCFEGATRPLTVGEVNGRIFLNNASIGFYPMILSVREKTYRRWGRSRFAAYWSVLRSVFRSHLNMRLTITVDGHRREVRTPMMFVARNTVQLEEFQVTGIRCVNEDGFMVYTLRPASKIGMLKLGWRALVRRLKPHHDFDVFCARQMRIESRRILRTVAFDGERIKMLAPLEFRIRQNALNVIVPSISGKELAA